MKIFVIFLCMSVFSAFGVTPPVEVKYINDVISKASPEEVKDLSKLLGQLSFVPAHKDPASHEQLFKVTMVEKGSIYERHGIKVGDFIANGSSVPTTTKPKAKLEFDE